MSQQRFRISLEDGRVMDRHIDDVRHRVFQMEGDEFKQSTDPILPDLGLSGECLDQCPDPPADIARSATTGTPSISKSLPSSREARAN